MRSSPGSSPSVHYISGKCTARLHTDSACHMDRLYSYKRNEDACTFTARLLAMYLVAVSQLSVMAADRPRILWVVRRPPACSGAGSVSTAFMAWIAILLIYVYIASTLPVWKLLQPRDFINSHQLTVGLLILYAGLLLTNPTINAPTINRCRYVMATAVHYGRMRGDFRVRGSCLQVLHPKRSLIKRPMPVSWVTSVP